MTDESLTEGIDKTGRTVPPVVEPPARSGRRRVASLLVLLALFVVADQAARIVTMHRLALAIERSEGVMLHFMEGVDQTLTSVPESPSQTEIDWVLETHSSLAIGASEELRVRRGDVEAVEWFAWHTEIGRAKYRYLAHVDAWLNSLALPSEKQLLEPAPLIEATWNVAADALGDAVPIIDLGVRERVDEIIRVGSSEDAGGSA